MAEPTFSSVDGGVDDDLPRTLRREREAQARRAREKKLSAAVPEPAIAADSPAPGFEPEPRGFEDPPEATVSRLDIPFGHLVLFFLKAVIAGIPALILLLAILWGVGEILTATFPELIKVQLLIRMPE